MAKRVLQGVPRILSGVSHLRAPHVEARRDNPSDTLYVSVEYLDVRGRMYLQYDAGEGESAHVGAPEHYEQTGTGQWRTAVFTLWDPVLAGHQNGSADFRIGASHELVIARIALSSTPPEGHISPANPSVLLRDRVQFPQGMAIIQQWQIHEPVPKVRLTDEAYEVCKAVGVTSLQSYVGWAQIEPRPGQADLAMYDLVVEKLTAHGLKWLPFLIASTYVATPEWFRQQDGVSFRCLEHGMETPIQSIWNPALRGGVRRFLQVFRDHYDPGVIEALNLGISGNWGESIMVEGGGFDFEDKHTHLGWWCGDSLTRTWCVMDFWTGCRRS